MSSMSEKDPLLYSTSASIANFVSKAVFHVKRTEAVIKNHYSKAIRVIHARKFLAEFLATFILVVRTASPCTKSALPIKALVSWPECNLEGMV